MKKFLFIAAVILLPIAFIGGALYHNAQQAEQAGQAV